MENNGFSSVPGDPGWGHKGSLDQDASRSNRENRAIENIGEFSRLSNRSDCRSSLSRHMRPAHLSATRMLGYALILGQPVDWADFTSVIAVRLTPIEKLSLAYAALRALPDDEIRAAVAEAAIDGDLP